MKDYKRVLNDNGDSFIIFPEKNFKAFCKYCGLSLDKAKDYWETKSEKYRDYLDLGSVRFFKCKIIEKDK